MDNEQYDIVYVLGDHSEDNEELRYSLRSIEQNAIGLRKIFIVGFKPDFISDDIIYIPAKDIYPSNLSNKDRNQWYKLELVCKDNRLLENFLFCSDDFILNKKSSWKDFEPRYSNIVTEDYLNQQNINEWTRTRISTLKRFNYQTYLWHPHMMSWLKKSLVLKAAEACGYKYRNDVIFHTFYYNYIQQNPVMEYESKEYHSPQQFNDRIRHISHWDIAFNYKPFHDAIKTKYYKISKYEKYDIPEEKYKYDFSIIIPCYNSEKYLGECIDSVLKNNFNGTYQIIAVDDGSSDSTLQILRRYEKNTKNFKLLIHEKNIGLGGARNTALNEVEGRFVIFLDSDDKLRNDYMEKVFEKMDMYNLDIFYIYGESFFNDKKTEQQQKRYKNYYHTKPQFPSVLNGLDSLRYTYAHNDNTFSACLNIIRMDFIRKNNLRYVPDIYYEDTPFNIEATLKANRVFNTTEKLYLRRVHNDSIVIQSKNFKHFHGYVNAAYEMNSKIDANVMDAEMNYQIKIHTVGVYMKQAVKLFETNKENKNKIFSNMRNFNYRETLKRFNELLKFVE